MTTEIVNNGYISFDFIVGFDIEKTTESMYALKIPSRSIDVMIGWTATRSKIVLSKKSVDLLSDQSLKLRIDQYKQVGEFQSSLGTGEINSEFHIVPGIAEAKRDFHDSGEYRHTRLTYYFRFFFLDEFGNDFQDIHIYNSVANFHLCESMGKLLNENKFSDVTLVCKGGTLQAHKLLLSSRSEVFERMFQTDMLETQNKSVECAFDHGVMKAILEYMYIGKVIDCNINELFVAADYYALSNLRNICEQMMMKQICVERAISTLILAYTYNADQLLDKALNFIVINIKTIIVSDDYIKLSKKVSSDEYKEIMQSIVAAFAKVNP